MSDDPTSRLNDLLSSALEGTLEEAAEAAAEASAILDQIKAQVSAVHAAALQKIPSGRSVVLDNGLSVEHKVGMPRKKWDHAQIKRDIIRRLVQSHSDPDTGDLEAPIEDLLMEVLDFPSVSAWKVTSLKRLDLVADDYCSVGDPKESIVITRTKES